MFYVSSSTNGGFGKLYGVTDSEDGVEEFYTKEQLREISKSIPIKGVSKTGVKVVGGISSVAQPVVESFANVVRDVVNGYGEDTIMELARSIHFVKKLKGLDLAGMRQVAYDYVYPASVQDVVQSAADYTNTLHSIQTTPDAIMNALRSNVCLVLQYKTNGALTAFICTGSMAVLDAVYEPLFWDKLYLTKSLQAVTTNVNRMRKKAEPREKDPDMINVFSCSLRFRRQGKNHDGALKELSSATYTVNLPKVLAIFALDNPKKIGDSIIPEFYNVTNRDEYIFDFDMYQDITKCIMSNANLFLNEDNIIRYINQEELTGAVDLNEVMSRFEDSWSYRNYLRGTGYSF